MKFPVPDAIVIGTFAKANPVLLNAIQKVLVFGKLAAVSVENWQVGKVVCKGALLSNFMNTQSSATKDIPFANYNRSSKLDFPVEGVSPVLA